jgi:MFS family permease
MAGTTPEPVSVPTVVPAGRPWLGPVLLVMAATAISQGFARFTFAFVLPAMKEDLLGSYGAAGLLGAANLGAYTAAVLAVTARPPRADPSIVIKVGLAGSCAGLLLMTVATASWMLLFGMCIVGACGALIWLPASGIVAATAPAERRGLAYGLMIMGVGLGITLSGLLTGAVQAVRGEDAWREVWAAVTVIALLVLVMVSVWLRPVAAPIAVPVRSWRALRGEFPVARTCWCYGFYGIGFSIFVNYLIAALRDAGLTSAEANRAYSLLGLASIVSAVLVGRISDHWHRSRTLGGAIVVTGLCAAATTVITGTAQLTVVVVLFGLVMTGIGSVLAAYLSDELPAAEVTTVLGAATLALGAAQFVAPPLGGWLADDTGSFTASYLVAGMASVLGGVLAWTLPSSRRPAR